MPRALAWWTVGTFVVMALAATIRLERWTYGADLGTFTQLILDAFGGMRDGIERGTHYRFHWSPTLVLLWPILTVFRSPLTLEIVQIAATVLVAPLIYALAITRTTPALALRLAILSLIYPPLLGVGWDEFHELGLATPLVLGMVLAADRRAWAWFGVCVVLIAGLREDLCIELAVVGLVLGIGAWRSRTAWLLTAAAGIASDALYYGVIVPRVGPWKPAHFYVYPFAPSLAALAIAPFVHPIAFVREFFTLGRLTYLLESFLPLALLPLRSRWTFLALPGFAIILLANDQITYHMGNHYGVLWIPWLLAATVFAAARLTAIRTVNAALAVSALVLIFFNPLHPAHFLAPNYHDFPAARAALACVPPDASVSTHDEWFTHISAQNHNATLSTIEGVDYLVFADDFPNAKFAAVVLPQIRASVEAGRYRERCRIRNVVTYERAGLEPRH